MRYSLRGLDEELARTVAAALDAAGHEPGSPAELAVVAVDPPIGGELARLPDGRWADGVATLRDAFFALQRSARELVAGALPGRLLVVVPAHSLRPAAGCGLAAVAGSFLTTVAQVAAAELGRQGITVNVLALGPLEGRAPDRVAAAVPLGRLARPADLAAACRLLASPDADFLTGAVIAVDGGYQITKAAGGSPFSPG